MSETEHVSVFEADASAQRASDEHNVALVKDRRHTTTKLIRVWVNGMTVFCTAHKHKSRT